MERGSTMRVEAIMRSRSQTVAGGRSAIGVPGIGTRALTGTDSGGTFKLARV